MTAPSIKSHRRSLCLQRYAGLTLDDVVVMPYHLHGAEVTGVYLERILW